jgi:hypothetical protein
MTSTLAPPNYYLNDDVFDTLLPIRQQQLSRIHWTPLHIAKKAASFLAQTPGAKVLDIGSGVGKFCLTAAAHFPDAEFYGIEQREDLVEIANSAKQTSETCNAHFKHGNFTQIELDGYDSIYFYNSFCENIIAKDLLYEDNLSNNNSLNLSDLAHIDDRLELSASLYHYYSNYLHEALDQRPTGTRLATFHGVDLEVPFSYNMVDEHFDNALKFWVRK